MRPQTKGSQGVAVAAAGRAAFSEEDAYLFREGTHASLDTVMG